ncbi:MAG TPA: hypothetical protein VL171_13320 [Verrucomicrobiae bacterium]|nr:hypothetical protein [Verrucomicrobiae bacterium]
MNRWFYGVFGALVATGVLWLPVHWFGPENSATGTWLIKFHGAAAMASLVVLGALLPTHMQRAWGQRRNRLTALVMVSLCLSLVASGYGLYYFGGEELRTATNAFHCIAGCALPAVLTWHIAIGRRRGRSFSRPSVAAVLQRPSEGSVPRMANCKGTKELVFK